MKHIHYTEVQPEEVDDPEAKDVVVRWLIKEEDGAGNFVMRRFTVAAGGFTPYHTHAYEHEVFVVEGTGTLRFGDKEEPLREGDVVFVPANAEHQFTNSGEGDFSFLCLIPRQD